MPMDRIRAFFAWWFGELHSVFSGRRRSPVALVFSQHEIALLERGTDTALGIVGHDDPDRAARIETLRSIAEKRTGPGAPVEIRLPREQVIFREIEAPVSENGTRNLAVRIAETCERQAHELTAVSGPAIRLADTKKPGVLVAAALTDSVNDAVRMARDWGFEALRVTSVDWPRKFVDGPEFYARDIRLRSPLRSRALLAFAAVVAVLAIAAAGRTLYARSVLADKTTLQAARMPQPNVDMMKVELDLAEFAHAASSAIEDRSAAVPAWYILSELATLLPPDIALETVDYTPGEITLKGEGASLDVLARNLERSPLFSGVRIRETKRRGPGTASFDIGASVNGRGPT